MGASGSQASEMYQRTDKILTAAINDELVMMSVELGQYFGLNSVGLHIWSLLETPKSFDAIVAILTAEYDGDAEVIRSEVAVFLARLESEGLLKHL